MSETSAPDGTPRGDHASPDPASGGRLPGLPALPAHLWWIALIQGLAAIVYGILAFTWPFATGAVLVMFFAAFALVTGVSTLIHAFGRRGASRWWLEALSGVAGIVVGIMAILWPGLTMVTLLYFVAAWAVVSGAFEIGAAVDSKLPGGARWMLGIGGAVSVLFGLLLLIMNPAEGILALVWLIGIHALVFGVCAVIRALQIRKAAA